MTFLKYLLQMFGKKKLELAVSIPLGTFSQPNDKIEVPLPPTTPPPTASGDPLPPLAPTFSEPKTPNDVFHAFVLKMRPIADAIESTHGIHPVITLSQSAHESGWGLSDLTKDVNNLFGMTAGSWMESRRPVKWYPTNEESDFPPEKIHYWEYADDIIWKKPNGRGGTLLKVSRPFRAYESWLASVQDWANKISLTDKYRTAYEFARKGDLENFSLEAKKAGYATDSRYATELPVVGQKIVSILKDISNA